MMALAESLQQLLLKSLETQNFIHNLTREKAKDLCEVIMDKAVLLRFLKKYKQSIEESQMALIAHLDWRLNENMHQVCLDTCNPAIIRLLEDGLFRFFKTDYLGRPVAYLVPKLFIPNSVEAADNLKGTLILCLEILRRWIHSLSENALTINQPVLQALIVVNLEGFGVTNMDYGLIPIIYDLFRYQYPQLLGQVVVLNYGWVHAGIWGFVNPLLTAEARSKLVFIGQEKLIDYISVENIPQVFGGQDSSFPISYHVCPVIQSFSSSNLIQKHSAEFQRIFNMLLSHIDNSPRSPDSADDVFYDALPYSLAGPKMVKSSADLQQLLPSHSSRGIGRANSTASLSKLYMRSKSNSNLGESSSDGFRTSKSHTSLAQYSSSQYLPTSRELASIQTNNAVSASDDRNNNVRRVKTSFFGKFLWVCNYIRIVLRWFRQPRVRNRIIFALGFVLLKKYIR